MVAIIKQFAKAKERILKGEIDLSTDTLKIMLLDSDYVVDLDLDDIKTDIDSDQVSGTGYTAGGAALASVTLTRVAADSWAVARANSTAYALGDIVRPATGNDHLYRCVAAGTSAGSIPTYPTTPGATVTDGTVTWAECGTAAIVLDSADPSWTTATFTARYAAVYDDTHASDALLFYYDPGLSLSPVAGTLTIPWPSTGIFAELTN